MASDAPEKLLAIEYAGIVSRRRAKTLIRLKAIASTAANEVASRAVRHQVDPERIHPQTAWPRELGRQFEPDD